MLVPRWECIDAGHSCCTSTGLSYSICQPASMSRLFFASAISACRTASFCSHFRKDQAASHPWNLSRDSKCWTPCAQGHRFSDGVLAMYCCSLWIVSSGPEPGMWWSHGEVAQLASPGPSCARWSHCSNFSWPSRYSKLFAGVWRRNGASMSWRGESIMGPSSIQNTLSRIILITHLKLCTDYFPMTRCPNLHVLIINLKYEHVLMVGPPSRKIWDPIQVC